MSVSRGAEYYRLAIIRGLLGFFIQAQNTFYILEQVLYLWHFLFYILIAFKSF